MLLLGAFKVAYGAEVACKCSHPSLFITLKIPKAMHGTHTAKEGQNFKHYAKRLLFTANFTVFWTQKGVPKPKVFLHHLGWSQHIYPPPMTS